MKNKYIIKIKGLDQNEQTEFIYQNLSDNIVRIKVLLLILLFVEAIFLAVILTTDLMFDTMEERFFCFQIYLVAVPILLLFLLSLQMMGKHIKRNKITLFRITILFGLMLLLAWSTSMKLLLQDSSFQPNLYIILLIAVAVVPFLNYWETVSIVFPSQVFITLYTMLSSNATDPKLINYLVNTWTFVVIVVLISQLTYKDRITYFLKDLQLTKQNALLRQHSEIDALTGVYNRRKLDETMESEWKRSSRTGRAFSFLLIDLDHFKDYNDEYGHIEGDICLRRTAAIMKKTLKRSSDTVFRYGGEEFGVILPFTDQRSAELVAEKLRRNIEKAGIIQSESETGFLTISIGLTSSVGKKEGNYNSMYLEADKALYAAKRSGRNKVIVFEK